MGSLGALLAQHALSSRQGLNFSRDPSFLFRVLFLSSPLHTLFFPYSVKTNIVSRNFSLFVHGAVTEEGATMPLMINQKWNHPEVPFVVDLTFLTLC